MPNPMQYSCTFCGKVASTDKKHTCSLDAPTGPALTREEWERLATQWDAMAAESVHRGFRDIGREREALADACRTMAAQQDAEAVLAALRTLAAGGHDGESSLLTAAQEAQTR